MSWFPASMTPLVHIRVEASGQFTAGVPGIPELTVTAPTREEAIEQLRRTVLEWFESGRLMPLRLFPPTPPVRPPGWPENDPMEQEFLAELARMRKEDLEQTLREYEEEDRACQHSSSTPTT